MIYSKQATLKIEDEGNYVFDLLLYPVSENPVTGTVEDKSGYDNDVSPIEEAKTDSSTDSFTLSYLPVTLMFLFLLGGGYKLSRKLNEIKGRRSQAGKSSTKGFLAKIFDKSPGFGVKLESGSTGEVASIKGSVIEPVGDSRVVPLIETAGNSEIETAALRKLPLSEDQLEILDVIRSRRGKISQKDLRRRLEYSEVKVSLLLSELEKRGLIKKLKHGRENIVVLTDEGRR